MRVIKSVLAGVALVVFMAAGVVHAGSNLNEVGAVLVFPAINVQGPVSPSETFVTITNASGEAKDAHLSFINGRQWHDPCLTGGAQPGVDCETQADPAYCYECDWTIPLSGNDTETILITESPGGGVVMQIEGDGVGDGGTDQHANEAQMTCDFPYGMLVVALEDVDSGRVLTDNVLLGEQVVVDYNGGSAYSMPAISLQGGVGGDGDRMLAFDDVEFGKLPRIVAADFMAPENDGNRFLRADLTLFTLAFDRQHPPETDCSITGYDADENPFSRSIRFGCWHSVPLRSISPEFAYPNLGQGLDARDTHGWVQVNCRVDPEGSVPPVYTVNGGVHGAITQVASNIRLRRGDAGFGEDKAGPEIAGLAAWGRLLYQSVTTGDAVTLTLEEEGSEGGMCDPLIQDCS